MKGTKRRMQKASSYKKSLRPLTSDGGGIGYLAMMYLISDALDSTKNDVSLISDILEIFVSKREGDENGKMEKRENSFPMLLPSDLISFPK